MHFELTTSFNIRHIQFTLWIPSVTRKLYYIIHSDTKISRYSFLKLLHVYIYLLYWYKTMWVCFEAYVAQFGGRA